MFIFLAFFLSFVHIMSTNTNTLLPNNVTYNRKECPDLLQYAKANRNDGTFNDVTIQTGHLSIGANRMVLSCCSTFFEKMFKSQMKERYESSITIHEIDSTAVKHVIDYMYEGSITIDNTTVMDILAAADFLQLPEIKLFCFEFLKEHISSGSWYAVLSAAKLYRCDQLQKYTYQFITDHLDEITKSDDFKTVAKDDLTSLILNLRKNKKAVNESVVCKLVIDWTKQDEEERKAVFADLFQMIHLDKVSLDFLECLFEESLVKDNPVCGNAITVALFSMLKTNQQTSKENKSLTIFSVGGSQGIRKVLKIFNLSKREEQEYPDYPYAVRGHCTVKLDGIVYCIGGSEPRNISNVYNKVYQIKLNETNLKWKEADPLNRKRCMMGAAIFRDWMGAAIFRDCLVVAGGSNGQCILSSVEYSSSPFNLWKESSPLRHKRCGNALAVCNGSLYALGGFDGTACLSSVERLYNQLRDDFPSSWTLYCKWQNVAPMLTPRFGFAVVSLNDCLFAIGGQSERKEKSALKTVEKYDPGLNKWTCVSEMTYNRSFHCACVYDKNIFVIGGIDDSGNVIKEIECYESSKDKWSIMEDVQYPLDNFAVFSN